MNFRSFYHNFYYSLIFIIPVWGFTDKITANCYKDLFESIDYPYFLVDNDFLKLHLKLHKIALHHLNSHLVNWSFTSLASFCCDNFQKDSKEASEQCLCITLHKFSVFKVFMSILLIFLKIYWILQQIQPIYAQSLLTIFDFFLTFCKHLLKMHDNSLCIISLLILLRYKRFYHSSSLSWAAFNSILISMMHKFVLMNFNRINYQQHVYSLNIRVLQYLISLAAEVFNVSTFFLCSKKMNHLHSFFSI